MSLRRTISLAALGLAASLVTKMIAMGLAAAGHGWIAPVFLSIPLLILYPVTLARMHGPTRMAAIEGVTIGSAVILNILLIWSSLSERDYAARIFGFAPQLVLLWLILWFGWQAAAIIGFRRGRLAR